MLQMQKNMYACMHVYEYEYVCNYVYIYLYLCVFACVDIGKYIT